jgi:hypothetical protein
MKLLNSFAFVAFLTSCAPVPAQEEARNEQFMNDHAIAVVKTGYFRVKILDIDCPSVNGRSSGNVSFIERAGRTVKVGCSAIHPNGNVDTGWSDGSRSFYRKEQVEITDLGRGYEQK